MAPRSKPAYIAPAGFFIMFPISFIITLLLSLSQRHVRLLLPYISDTGDWPPESCVFSALVSLCAVILGVSVYTRHLQVSQRLGTSLCNSVSSGCGTASALGLLLVANFQEDNVYLVHFSGAALCIWAGTVYFILQTVISHMMQDQLTSMAVHYVRVFLATLSVLVNIIGIITTVAAFKHAPEGTTAESVSVWSTSDEFWVVHVLSVSAEWSLALLQSAIVLSFVPELKRFKVVFPKLKIKNISPA